MSTTTNNFSDWLKYRRTYAGLTREALAERADISEDTVRMIETRQRAPSLEMFIRLCRALSYPADRVLRIIAPLHETALDEVSHG